MGFRQLRSEILWTARQCRQRGAGAEELVEILREALAEAVRVWDAEIEHRARRTQPAHQRTTSLEALQEAIEQLMHQAKQTEPHRLEDSLYLTSKQAAAYMGLSPRTVESWRSTEDGPSFVRISNRSIRYERAHLDEWMQRRVRRSTSDPGEDEP